MPAYNMAGPRSSTLEAGEAFRYSAPVANPNLGATVLMSPFSGPSGSPLDAKVYAANTTITKTADVNNTSTGALSTGIGFSPACEYPGGITTAALGVTLAASKVGRSGFDDDYTPGVTLPNGTASTTAILTAIGGGKCTITPGAGSDYSRGVSTLAPYVAQPLLGYGNGGSRDAGAGPAFTGFAMKTVTAAADVAAAGVVETGFVNRSGAILKLGQSQFGSASAASAAVT